MHSPRAEAFYGYGPYLDRAPQRAGQSRLASDNREEKHTRHRGTSARRAGRKSRRRFRRRSRRFRHGGRGLRSDRSGTGKFSCARHRRSSPASPRCSPSRRGSARRLGHDFCAISLSDNLKPWPLIERRLDAAAGAGFVVALYNPVSRARPWQFGNAIERLRRHLPATTPVIFGRAVGTARRADRRGDARRRRDGEGRHGNAGHRRLARDPHDRAAGASSAGLYAARRRRGERMIEPGDRIVHGFDPRHIGRASAGAA